MTQFASRVVNTDPRPYRVMMGFSREASLKTAPDYRAYVYEPRDEYTLFPSNPVNPILLEFRETLPRATGYTTPELAEHWTKSDYQWDEMCLVDYSMDDEHIGTPEQEEHARKVLTRLARLG